MTIGPGSGGGEWPLAAIHHIDVPVAVVRGDGVVEWGNPAWTRLAASQSPQIPLRYEGALSSVFGLGSPDAAFIAGRVLESTALRDAPTVLTRVVGDRTLLIQVVPMHSLPETMYVALHLFVPRETSPRQDDHGAMFRMLVESIPAAVYIQLPNPAEGMLYISSRIEAMVGYTVSEFLADPTTWLRSIHSDDVERVLAERQKHSSSGVPSAIEYRVVTREGRIAWLHDESVPMLDDEGVTRYRHGIILDITEQKHVEERLIHQAFHDQLTGLPSRALFMNRLESALARSERRSEITAVLFLDLDRFKVINDSMGHAVGDELLIQIGERLRTIVRPGDTVARLGGDEFIVLAEDVMTPDVATRIASRIITGIRQPFLLQGQEVFVTTSVGIAFSIPGISQASELVRDADIALYRAKAEGRGRYAVFDTSVDRHARERLNLEFSLRQAVDENQFVVHYQPIVSLETGAMTATEALLRWEHPTRGLLLPEDFLDVAEDTGLLTPIGQRLLEEACRQAHTWRTRYPHRAPLSVVVNLSPNQFRQTGLIEQVRRAIWSSGLDPYLLRLELTEDAIAYDRESALQKIRDLKALGIQLSIDGFGTGNTSLAHLANLPVDVLEIDRHFVSGKGFQDRGQVLMQAIASLASALGTEVGAEGIETTEQLARVLAAGIRRGQGNLFSQPVPPDAIDALLDAQNHAWDTIGAGA